MVSREVTTLLTFQENISFLASFSSLTHFSPSSRSICMWLYSNGYYRCSKYSCNILWFRLKMERSPPPLHLPPFETPPLLSGLKIILVLTSILEKRFGPTMVAVVIHFKNRATSIQTSAIYKKPFIQMLGIKSRKISSSWTNNSPSIPPLGKQIQGFGNWIRKRVLWFLYSVNLCLKSTSPTFIFIFKKITCYICGFNGPLLESLSQMAPWWPFFRRQASGDLHRSFCAHYSLFAQTSL